MNVRGSSATVPSPLSGSTAVLASDGMVLILKLLSMDFSADMVTFSLEGSTRLKTW